MRPDPRTPGARPRAFSPRALLAAIVMLVAAGPAGAQDDRYAPLVLQLPASTRAAGLGGAFVAVRDVESHLANPALTGTAVGTAASAERYHAATQGTLSMSAMVGAIGVAVSAQYLDFTAPLWPPNGAGILPAAAVPSGVLNDHQAVASSNLVGAFALSTTFKGLRWGGAAKYVAAQLGADRESTAAFDVGVAREGGPALVGLSVQNLGAAPGDNAEGHADLPLRATLGASRFGLQVGPLDLGLSAAVSVLRSGFVAPAAGMEWSYTPLEGYTFALRAGVRRPELDVQRPFAFGASFSLDRVSLDYAFEGIDRFGGHRVGVRIR